MLRNNFPYMENRKLVSYQKRYGGVSPLYSIISIISCPSLVVISVIIISVIIEEMQNVNKRKNFDKLESKVAVDGRGKFGSKKIPFSSCILNRIPYLKKILSSFKPPFILTTTSLRIAC